MTVKENNQMRESNGGFLVGVVASLFMVRDHFTKCCEMTFAVISLQFAVMG